MKIKVLLITFFLSAVFADTTLGQEKGEMTYSHQCFKQLEITVKNYGYLKDNKAYGWGVKIKNNYKTAVKFTYKLSVGDEKSGGGQPTYYIEPGKTWSVDWGRLALLLKSSSSNEYKVDIWGLCFEGYDCSDNNYFDCEGRQIKEKLFGSNWKNSNSTGQNANKSNDQNNSTNDNQKTNQATSQANIMELISKKNNLCQEMFNLVKKNGTTNPVYEELCAGTPSNYSINDYARLNNDITRLENAIGMVSKQAQQAQEKIKAQEVEQQRIRKAQETKRAQFDGAIQNGDNALSSKQYDNAMSYYSLAKNYAQNSNESTFAQNKYNQAFEGKKTAERQVRVEKQKEKDRQENLEYAGLATGMGGMMAMLNDSYSYKWYAMKFQAGLGYENLPIYSNNASQYHVNKSYIESFTLPTFHMGFKAGFFNNKAVSFVLNPGLNVGFSAFSPGTSGGYVEYGSTASLYLSHKAHSRFKVFAEGGYFKKEGNYSYDEDAARGGNSATDDVRKGTLKYDIIKYGGGFMFHWVSDGKETYLRPAVFYEKPSFFAKDAKPVLSYNFQVNILSEIMFDFSYATDYFIGGEVAYPTTLQPEKMDYFSIKIIKQGKLF